jgi:hypothetical protein
MITGSPVNILDYGVQYTSTYNEAIAQQNRVLIESALRDTDNKFVIFPPSTDTLFVCGSIHPLRNDLTIWHQAGCNIVGFDENSTIFAGHLFGFVQYADPDNGDFTVTGTTTDITYILDGDLKAVYGNAISGNTYNNNGIGFKDVNNCQVVGNGGISQCNHVGINFDGDADNCHIDVNYVKQCSTINVAMKGSATSMNTVKVKNLSNSLFDDTVNQPNARSSVYVRGHVVDVDVDHVVDTQGFPIVLSSEINEHVYAKFGLVEGSASALVRGFETKNITIHQASYSNLQNVVAIATRAGSPYSAIPRNVVIKNVTCVDASVVSTERIVEQQGATAVTDFERMIVRDCNFSASPTLVDLFDNISIGYCDISNTMLPSSYNYSSVYSPRIKSKNLASYDDASFVFNSNDIYGVIGKVHIQIVATGTTDPRYVESVDLVLLGPAAAPDYKININSTVGDVTVERTGSSYTFTAPSGYKFGTAEGEYI